MVFKFVPSSAVAMVNAFVTLAAAAAVNAIRNFLDQLATTKFVQTIVATTEFATMGTACAVINGVARTAWIVFALTTASTLCMACVATARAFAVADFRVTTATVQNSSALPSAMAHEKIAAVLMGGAVLKSVNVKKALSESVAKTIYVEAMDGGPPAGMEAIASVSRLGEENIAMFRVVQ